MIFSTAYNGHGAIWPVSVGLAPLKKLRILSSIIEHCHINRCGAASRSGFTLLEVMVSISLIAIVFVTLFRMQSGIVRLSRSSEFYTIAPVLARQVLDNMDQDIVETGEVSGRFEEDAPGYEWHLRVHDTMAEDIEFISQDNLESFKKIEVNITGPKETETFVVTTWRFFP